MTQVLPEELTGSRRDELDAALRIARQVGANLLHFNQALAADRKVDGSLVTAADVAADRSIASYLADRFPDDAVVSEEVSTAYEGQRRVWVVDPLDGTSNFAQRVPIWGVSLALIEEGRPVVGVSHFPTMHLTFSGVRGVGAWEQGRPLVTPDTAAEPMIAQCSRTPNMFKVDVREKPRILGSATFSYALVAAGAVRSSIAATARLWDLAAGWLLIEEAGGTIGMLTGSSPWPLEPGDYAGRGFSTLAAVSAEEYAVVRSRISPRDGRQRHGRHVSER